YKYLTRHRPDLILLDYLMPDKDGPQVLRELRMIREYADIPVVFLTGMSEKQAVLKTLKELRPQGYIIKPAKKSELVAKIIDVLG
ncbi:MAG: response regulator, partial [Lachnospiraceae bacterium]|nr:response regulator [Lachnospiraceae bacterium]